MKLALALAGCLVLLIGGAALYWKYKHRARVDEFGHPIVFEPGAGKVTPGANAKLEDASERGRLPLTKDVPAAATAELAPTSGDQAAWGEGWLRSQGDSASSRYSNLSEITRGNVAQLTMAWTYHSNDGKANVQATPVIENGVLYAPTAGNFVVALDAASGRELWRFQPGGHPAQRGLLYWRNPKTGVARLYFTSGAHLFSLDPKTGKPAPEFGSGGQVPSGGMVSPVIAAGVLIAANFNTLSGFDPYTGRKLWSFDVLPPLEAGRPGSNDRGANVWGGMAADDARGLVFAATGAPHPNFLGLDHPGENKHANSVLALDAKSGQLKWDFQEISHDIWDLDLPAPPNLVTITHEGNRVDAVAQVTKLGNTLLLDRLTGKPLFPYQLRRAPVSKLPGERTSPYQAVFTFPQPFTKQEFREADITDLSPAAHNFVVAQVKKANFGWFEPFEAGKGTVYYGVNGGAEWTGASFDPESGRLFVSANEIPWIMTILKTRARATAAGGAAPSAGEAVFRQYCAGCHGPDRKGKGMAPALLGLANRMLDDEVTEVITHGRNAMPPIAVPAEKRQQLIEFLFDRDLPADTSPVADKTEFTYFPNGYPKLMDDSGYPGTKPPWGTLNAIDLNTGKLLWKVPLGEYEELTRRGVPVTGTENFGGATVTRGGLVFCAGTRDKKIRAFDKDTGKELWSAKLPFGGFAPPAVYAVAGREYVVIAATGGGKLGGVKGDTYVAFALPQK